MSPPVPSSPLASVSSSCGWPFVVSGGRAAGPDPLGNIWDFRVSGAWGQGAQKFLKEP